MSKWIKRLSSRHREKEKELVQASGRVSVAIARYKDMSMEIQEEIQRNKFARFLVYDKGDHHGGN
ncbi:hypothetical protein [Paenibacillus apii]|uniref:hypothetical protein n=1 Tax=Paenibacillus apii TaxID=1850370 RepID=UPI001F3144D5